VHKKKITRNAAGAGSIRQRPDGKWEGRYTAGMNPGTGRQVQKSIYGVTQREVVNKLTAIKAGINAGTFIEPSKLTVSAWLDIWTSEYLGGVKARTVENYKCVCKNHLKPNIGAVKLSELSPHMIQTMMNRLQKEYIYKDKNGKEKIKKGLSAKTIKNTHGVLHATLQQAVINEYIQKNPADSGKKGKVKLPHIEQKEMQVLDEDAITAFLDAVHGHEWENLFTVTLFTGARQAEILGLTWGRIDFERGTILIDRQLERGKRDSIGLETPKNDKSRRITPAPFVMATLKAQRRQQLEWRLLAGPAWVKSDYVFTNELGQTLVHGTVSKGFKRIITKTGFPETRFHDLRHSYATAALSSGDDVKTVQENLGHHDPGFTLRQYGHVTEKMKKESAARMERFIESVKRTS